MEINDLRSTIEFLETKQGWLVETETEVVVKKFLSKYK